MVDVLKEWKDSTAKMIIPEDDGRVTVDMP
jgi:hypothetical protein